MTFRPDRIAADMNDKKSADGGRAKQLIRRLLRAGVERSAPWFGDSEFERRLRRGAVDPSRYPDSASRNEAADILKMTRVTAITFFGIHLVVVAATAVRASVTAMGLVTGPVSLAPVAVIGASLAGFALLAVDHCLEGWSDHKFTIACVVLMFLAIIIGVRYVVLGH